MILAIILFLVFFNTSYGVITVQVFKHGEDGNDCIRIPSVILAGNHTLVAFAECRKYIGDGCYPKRRIRRRRRGLNSTIGNFWNSPIFKIFDNYEQKNSMEALPYMFGFGIRIRIKYDLGFYCIWNRSS